MCSRTESCLLTAIRCKAEILAEEWQHVVLESIGDCAGVRTRVNFKAVSDSVVIEDGVQFYGIESQPVLIAYIHKLQ